MNWSRYIIARAEGCSTEEAEREAEELPSIQHMNWIDRFEQHHLETLDLELEHQQRMYEWSLAVKRAQEKEEREHKKDVKHQSEFPKTENPIHSTTCSVPTVPKPVVDIRRKTIKRALDSYYPTIDNIVEYARISDVVIPSGADRNVVIELILKKMIKDL